MAEDLLPVWDPIEFSWKDFPTSLGKQDNQALTDSQKENLQQKIKEKRHEDIKYLYENLEIRAIIREVFEELINKKPLDLNCFFLKLFTQPKSILKEKIERHLQSLRKPCKKKPKKIDDAKLEEPFSPKSSVEEEIIQYELSDVYESDSLYLSSSTFESISSDKICRPKRKTEEAKEEICEGKEIKEEFFEEKYDEEFEDYYDEKEFKHSKELLLKLSSKYKSKDSLKGIKKEFIAYEDETMEDENLSEEYENLFYELKTEFEHEGYLADNDDDDDDNLKTIEIVNEVIQQQIVDEVIQDEKKNNTEEKNNIEQENNNERKSNGELEKSKDLQENSKLKLEKSHAENTEKNE